MSKSTMTLGQLRKATSHLPDHTPFLWKDPNFTAQLLSFEVFVDDITIAKAPYKGGSVAILIEPPFVEPVD